MLRRCTATRTVLLVVVLFNVVHGDLCSKKEKSAYDQFSAPCGDTSDKSAHAQLSDGRIFSGSVWCVKYAQGVWKKLPSCQYEPFGKSLKDTIYDKYGGFMPPFQPPFMPSPSNGPGPAPGPGGSGPAPPSPTPKETMKQPNVTQPKESPSPKPMNESSKIESPMLSANTATDKKTTDTEAVTPSNNSPPNDSRSTPSETKEASKTPVGLILFVGLAASVIVVVIVIRVRKAREDRERASSSVDSLGPPSTVISEAPIMETRTFVDRNPRVLSNDSDDTEITL